MLPIGLAIIGKGKGHGETLNVHTAIAWSIEWASLYS